MRTFYERRKAMISSRKTHLSMGAAALLGFAALAMTTTPAHARKSCYFIAHHPATGQMIADGYGTAVKKKWACNRAERRCKRELKRKKRKGLDRGALGATCGQAW
jgi:hypothetical protein